MVDVFIVGCKGIPANYGGFETFVENLIKGKKSPDIKYHVSCMSNEGKRFEYGGADCFDVGLPLSGAPGRILHVGLALRKVLAWRKDHKAEACIVYILGCRIGPLLYWYADRLHKFGIRIFCNPDGLEWKRDKWNSIEKRFLKLCESSLVKCSDLSVCDSLSIEKYIHDRYPKKDTTYIAYGAETRKSECNEEDLNRWYKRFELSCEYYYLIVGRFVPENNYETMIREFMESRTDKDLVIISNVEQNDYYRSLMDKTHFENDRRIKFVGTVYDTELLKKIRENAYAYIHGHEVGGTNPSLLESLACTKRNLLLDVGFNREAGRDGALYWDKDAGSLSGLIDECENLNNTDVTRMRDRCVQIIESDYSWKKICEAYEKLFLSRR